MEQGFGRDAADVQTGAAQGLTAFDTGNFQTLLASVNGSVVAAWTATDDNDVVVTHERTPE
jgi:hypothetical protein